MAKGKSKGKKKSRTKLSKSSEPDPNLYFGNGPFTLPNGDTYVGDYCAHRSGLIWREGFGEYKTQDGQTYTGEWKDDKLIENRELVVKYPNGAQYYGCIAKNKYKGPGTYILEKNMDLSCNFEGNKPTGIITLVDCAGKLWVGEAKQSNAILFPENIFFLTITDYMGTGYPIEDTPLITDNVEEEEQQNKEKDIPEITDREWEKIIFERSTKTENDVDFSDSKWIHKFEKFQARKEEILRKVDESESLTDEELVWIDKFKSYEKKKKQKEIDKVLIKKIASDEAMSLIQTFTSAEFNNSCPGIPVFYASSDLECDAIETVETVETAKVEDDHEDIDFEDCYKIDANGTTSELGSNATLVSFCDLEANCRSGRFDNWLKLKDYVKHLNLATAKLHFTEQREERLAMMREAFDQKEQAKIENAKGKTKDHEHEKSRESKGKFKRNGEDVKDKVEGKGKKNKTSTSKLSSKEEDKKSKSMVIGVVDEKAALQDRIKQYVAEYFEAKEVNDLTSKEATKSKSVTHTHDIGVDTDSIANIPTDLLSTPFGPSMVII